MKQIFYAAFSAVAILFVICIFQSIIIHQLYRLNGDTQKYLDYWRENTDSLADENFKLQMQIYDLKDSIITLKYE